MDNEMYLLLTRDQKPVGKGVLQSGSVRDVLQLKITDGDPEELRRCEVLCLIGSEPGEVPVMCKITGCRNESIVLKKVMTLDPKLRRTYRVPMHFDSFLYPVPESTWKGRIPVEAVDMSCGGFAFKAENALQEGSIAELVIPNIENPVLLNIKVLHKETLSDGRVLYGSKFLYECPQEEQAVFRSVLSIQLEHRRAGTEVDFKL